MWKLICLKNECSNHFLLLLFCKVLSDKVETVLEKWGRSLKNSLYQISFVISFLENGFKLLFDLLRPFWIRIFENFECFDKYFPLKLVGYRFLHQASYKSWNSLKSQNIFSWDYKISMSNLSLKNDNLLNLVTT